MSDQPLMARKIKVETPIRCDFDHLAIPRGKYATQVLGDPKLVKAQGLYHGQQCYHAALEDYNQKVKDLRMQEDEDE